MVKFGKEYRKAKFPDWESKYLDYKMLKKLINTLTKSRKRSELNPLQILPEVNIDTEAISTDAKQSNEHIKTIEEELNQLENEQNKINSEKKIINLRVTKFSETLDKEIKKFFIFFVNEEKTLYKNINMHLYQKDEYDYLELEEFTKEFKDLEDISNHSLKLTIFIYDNFRALFKILKKFDKKAFNKSNAEYKITQRYIQLKLEEQNSDILYILGFKMIDEVGALLEDLIGRLKRAYEANKSIVKDEFKEKMEEENSKSVDQSTDANTKIKEYNSQIASSYYEINKKIRSVDKKIFEILMLFQPWDKFLKISSDISSKLYALTKESEGVHAVPSEGDSKKLEQIKEENDKDNKNIGDKKKEIADLDSVADLNSSIILFAESSSMPLLYNKKFSILSNVYFSRENRMNIRLTLSQTFLFMFSYSVSLLPSLEYYKIFSASKCEKGHIIINAGLPIGILLSLTYSSALNRKSTKKSLIISTFFLFMGNLLYFVPYGKIKKNIILPIPLFISRFLIGLGSNRVANKMYLVNFVPKQYLNNYLAYFHFCTVVGMTIGFILIGIFVKTIPENKPIDEIFNYKTLGSFICSILSFILLLLEAIFSTEANDPFFISTNISLDGNKFLIERNELGIGKVEESKKDKSKPKAKNVNMSLSESINKDSLMIENTNSELEKFNVQCGFTDTNLVAKSITELTVKAKEELLFLRNSFIVFIFVIFTCKVLTEIVLIVTPIYIHRHSGDDAGKITDNLLAASIILGFTQLINCFLEYFCNMVLISGKCIKEKVLLLIMLILCFVIIIIELLIHDCKNDGKMKFYYVYMCFLLIFAYFVEKIANSFFGKIFPLEYKAGCLQGNVVLNIFTNFGRIIGAVLPLLSSIKEGETYCKIIFGIMAFFTFIDILLIFFFYSDIRIKAISRILGKENEMKIKVANEL